VQLAGADRKKIPLTETRALIAAAGRGSRAGLPYPKTLFLVQGKPILLRICGVLRPYDPRPTIIVSPSGEGPIRECLEQADLAAHFVRQPEPKGMGEAVLRFAESQAFIAAKHVLLIWGDVPFVQPETIAAMVEAHYSRGNDFTFVSRVVSSPYTIVLRNDMGEVTGVLETREAGLAPPADGERDIGLFIFRKEPVLNTLCEELSGKWGRHTGEQGFRYVIGHLVSRGCKVEGLPIGKEIETVSLNSVRELAGYA
jgi:bifunctional UDP-N-acetylglucosamine pyrophosphorylase / glucosamine-1-phosphate N-acetyltransferase